MDPSKELEKCIESNSLYSKKTISNANCMGRERKPVGMVGGRERERARHNRLCGMQAIRTFWSETSEYFKENPELEHFMHGFECNYILFVPLCGSGGGGGGGSSDINSGDTVQHVCPYICVGVGVCVCGMCGCLARRLRRWWHGCN